MPDRIVPPLSETVAAAEQRAARLPAPLRAVLGIPLFWKVLVANAALVVASAGAGSLLTARLEHTRPGSSPLGLLLEVGGAALLLSLLVNGIIVWVALRPLHLLEATVERIAAGDVDARAPISPVADRNLERLTHTVNAMLDGLDVFRRRLREIAARALIAAEQERKRIARELHDETAQTLAGLMLRVRLARAATDQETRDRVLDGIRDELSMAVERVRGFAMGLRPPALDMLGLVAALRSHAAGLTENSGVRVEVKADEDLNGLLGEDGELAVYRIVQAALSNVVHHSGASSARVLIRRGPRGVQVRISDEGRGFDVQEVLATPDAGLGLAGMQERAAYLSGQFSIHSEAGRGTSIDVEIPYQDTVAHA